MEDFVPYELAKKLKEKGFRERTLSMYLESVKLPHTPLIYSLKDWNKEDNCYSAPTISQVLKWLREKKKIEVVVLGQDYIGGPYFADVFTKDGLMNKAEPYPKYEQAAIAGIVYCLDNLI